MLINGSTPRYSAQPFAPYGKKLTPFDSHIGVTPCFRNRTGGRTVSYCVVVMSAVLRETPHREPGEVMVVQDWAGPSGRQWLEAERNNPRTKCPPIGGASAFFTRSHIGIQNIPPRSKASASIPFKRQDHPRIHFITTAKTEALLAAVHAAHESDASVDCYTALHKEFGDLMLFPPTVGRKIPVYGGQNARIATSARAADNRYDIPVTRQIAFTPPSIIVYGQLRRSSTSGCSGSWVLSRNRPVYRGPTPAFIRCIAGG